jgi:hypothetical protein
MAMITSNTKKVIPIESIDPKHSCLSFGCVSLGFVYHLSLTLTNKQIFSQRYRFIISKDLSDDDDTYEADNSNSLYLTSGEDQMNDNIHDGASNHARVIALTKLIAPGMKIDFIIELSAAAEKYSKYALKILQSGVADVLEYNVRAFVVPPDVYRSFRRTKQINGKTMAVDGVRVIRAIGMCDESRSVVSSSSSINSIAFVDEDDMEELMDYPIVSNTYWDPFEKILKVDNKLTQVFIDPGTSVEGCLQRTRELRDERYRELEDTGYYTSRLVSSFRAGQSM